jgi:hypothetical protein
VLISSSCATARLRLFMSTLTRRRHKLSFA